MKSVKILFIMTYPLSPKIVPSILPLRMWRGIKGEVAGNKGEVARRGGALWALRACPEQSEGGALRA
jgi:hypothetical protein